MRLKNPLLAKQQQRKLLRTFNKRFRGAVQVALYVRTGNHIFDQPSWILGCSRDGAQDQSRITRRYSLEYTEADYTKYGRTQWKEAASCNRTSSSSGGKQKQFIA